MNISAITTRIIIIAGSTYVREGKGSLLPSGRCWSGQREKKKKRREMTFPHGHRINGQEMDNQSGGCCWCCNLVKHTHSDIRWCHPCSQSASSRTDKCISGLGTPFGSSLPRTVRWSSTFRWWPPLEVEEKDTKDCNLLVNVWSLDTQRPQFIRAIKWSFSFVLSCPLPFSSDSIVTRHASPLPHLSMWLVTGNSGMHWQDFFFGSQTESRKLQSSVVSHLSPNFKFPRFAGSEESEQNSI